MDSEEITYNRWNWENGFKRISLEPIQLEFEFMEEEKNEEKEE